MNCFLVCVHMQVGVRNVVIVPLTIECGLVYKDWKILCFQNWHLVDVHVG
jgi:hypothetical protein